MQKSFTQLEHTTEHRFMMKYKSVDIENFSRFLQDEAPRALSYAARQTLNDAAYHARSKIAKDLPGQFILRNTWTLRSMQFEKTKEIVINKMRTSVGTTLKEMAQQEEGRTNVTSGKEGLPIPTTAAAGQEGRLRTKPVRKVNRMRNITLTDQRGFASLSRKQQNKAIVLQAAAKRTRYVFLKTDKVKGIFKVTGTKKRPVIRLIHNQNKKVTVVRPHPWLEPAVMHVSRMMPELFRKACDYQVARRAAQKMRRR